MGTTVVSAQQSGFAGSPFLDLVDVPSEVRSSVRRFSGRAAGAAATARSDYAGTAVGAGPWRLTRAGHRLVRSASTTAVAALAVLSVVAGASSAMSDVDLPVPVVGPAGASAGANPGTAVSGGQQDSSAAVGGLMQWAWAPVIGGVLAGSESIVVEPAAAGISARDEAGTGGVREEGQWTVVRPGDTLWEIAQRADPTSDPREMLVRLRDANGDEVENPVAGQRVRLPPG